MTVDKLAKGLGRYTVTYWRDPEETDEVWLVRVDEREVQGVHSDGLSIEEARANIRDALSCAVDDAWTAEFIDTIEGAEGC